MSAVLAVTLLAAAGCGLPERSTACPAAGTTLVGLGCELCAAQSCCSEASACAADPQCAALAACADASCSDDVFNANLHALTVCMASKCGAAACQAEAPVALCPAGSPATGMLGAGACELCLAERCCAEASDYQGDPGCSEIASCLVHEKQCATSATTPACYDSCRGRGDHAYALSARTFEEGLMECAVRECPNACRAGRAFECVDDYDWPAAPADANTLSLTFRLVPARPSTIVGYSGVTVTACTLLDNLCDVASSAPSDADGLATIAVPVNAAQASGFDGFFAFDGDGETVGSLFFRNGRVEYRDRPGDDATPTPTDAEITAGRLSQQGDENLGVVSGAALDCRVTPVNGMFARDLVVEIDSGRLIYVDDDRFPDSTLTATVGSGAFLIVDVDPTPGSALLTLTHPEHGVVGRLRVPVAPATERATVVGVTPRTRAEAQ